MGSRGADRKGMIGNEKRGSNRKRWELREEGKEGLVLKGDMRGSRGSRGNNTLIRANEWRIGVRKY